MCKTAWGPELKKATALTSRSMIHTVLWNPSLHDFSVEVDGDTYTAKLAGSEAAAQPAKRKTRIIKYSSRVRY